jgi:hypothetical protein
MLLILATAALLHGGGSAATALAQPRSTGPKPDVVVTGRAASYKMSVGQGLFLWEPGTQRPMARPGGDPHYLRLVYRKHIGQCPPNASCIAPPGFVWRYVAIQAGQTQLVLIPACRAAKPPCMLAERVIRISIRK